MPKFKAFFSEITEICDFRWSQGGSLLFIRECVFRGNHKFTISVSFLSKVIILGVARAPLPEKILYLVS